MILQKTIKTSTQEREILQDITEKIKEVVKEAANSGINTGICSVYIQGATAGIMIQENWDDSVQTDVINLMKKLIPKGVWLHDRQDGNGDSHLKAGITGPSETIPVINGQLGLST